MLAIQNLTKTYPNGVKALDGVSLNIPQGMYGLLGPTEVPLDDWVDVGAFAKPEKDRKYGKTLHRELVHVTQARSTYTFVTDQLPEKAGIDPFLLLIDRVPDDNTKKVTLASGPSTSSD